MLRVSDVFRPVIFRGTVRPLSLQSWVVGVKFGRSSAAFCMETSRMISLVVQGPKP